MHHRDFGASGDLNKRKLLPALYNLKALKLLPANFAVIGVAFTDGNDEMYRQTITDNIKQFATRTVDDAEWNDFATRSYYIQGDFNSTDTFKHLAAKIADAQKTWNLPGNVLFYLAVAPSSSRRLSTSSTVWVLPAKPAKRGGG